MTATRVANPQGTARQGLGATSRRDAWWLMPGIIATGFGMFIAYSLFSALIWEPIFHVPYEVDGYLSPFFSPLIFQGQLPWWLSPAVLILWIPLGFRTTCYYYRKAYYRSYFADPPGCAVGEPTIHRRYAMERAFPFILQNVHRYFLYLAFIPLFFLWIDALYSFMHPGPAYRPRQLHPARQRRPAQRLLAVMPFAAPPRRRPSRLLLVRRRRQGPLSGLDAADRHE